MSRDVDFNQIAPRFRSRKAFVNAMEKARKSIFNRGDPAINSERLNRFIQSSDNDGDAFSWGCVGFSNIIASQRYLRVADCLQLGCWDLPAYRNVWVCWNLYYQLRFWGFGHCCLKYPVEQCRGSIGLPVEFGDLVAMLSIFGNRNLFENAIKFSLDCFDHGLVGGDITYVTQLFILQLAEEFEGLAPRTWLQDKYWGMDTRHQPLFADLWRHWDDVDTSVLEPLLIQLLNRHTFQASRNNKDGGRDFEGHSELFPMEVMFIFRLRQWRGLSNPTLSHRIMEAPFDVLPEPMQDLVFDEQTIAFMKKVHEVFPDFDQTVNGIKIRDWKMLL